MRLPHVWHIATFFAYFGAYFGKVHILRTFPHKLAFSTAFLILFVFLLPISIRFRYLDLVANRLAPSMCPDPCGMRWGSWFQAILYHISTYFCRLFGVCLCPMRCTYFFNAAPLKLRPYGTIQIYLLLLL